MPEGDTSTTDTKPPEGTATAAADGKPAAGEPKFTQEELDRQIGERLARERAKFGDIEELRRKAEAHDKLEDERKTELERAVDNARKEADKAAREDRDGFWRDRLLRSEVKAAAAGKLNDPTDAVTLLDLKKFELDEDGNVDEKAVAAAIDELVKTKPYLAVNGTPRRPDFDAGPRTPGNGEDFNATLRRQLTKT